MTCYSATAKNTKTPRINGQMLIHLNHRSQYILWRKTIFLSVYNISRLSSPSQYTNMIFGKSPSIKCISVAFYLPLHFSNQWYTSREQPSGDENYASQTYILKVGLAKGQNPQTFPLLDCMLWDHKSPSN